MNWIQAFDNSVTLLEKAYTGYFQGQSTGSIDQMAFVGTLMFGCTQTWYAHSALGGSTVV